MKYVIQNAYCRMHTECIVVLYDYMMKWGSHFKVAIIEKMNWQY